MNVTLLQALRGLGYSSTAARLEDESSIPLQSDAVNRLQDGVLVGRWEECVTLLRELRLDNQDVYKNAKFLILQQKFLEALEEGSTGLALKVRTFASVFRSFCVLHLILRLTACRQAGR